MSGPEARSQAWVIDSFVTDAGANTCRTVPPDTAAFWGTTERESGWSNVLCAWISELVRTVAAIAPSEPPRTTISASRGSVACGFTTVRVRTLSLIDAEPLSPQNDAG